MITVYYIGGPWDLHKVAEKQPPDRTINIRMWKPGGSMGEVAYIDHEYIVRPVGKDVFVAVHSEIRPWAREAGWDVENGEITMPHLVNYYDPADETAFLTKFAALVAEDCARTAGSLRPGSAQIQANIRAKYPMPKGLG